MARQFFGVEKGLSLFAENGGLLTQVLSGTAVPDGLGDQAAAPIGSLYVRSGVGELYQKIANVGAPTDWQLNGSSAASIGTWRPEDVLLVTTATQGAGTRDVVASPFADDEGGAVPLSEFVVGRHIITGSASTPVLLRISAVAGNNVTFVLAATPLSAQDAFVVEYYLPDTPASQESQAIAVFNGTIMVKIADLNWNFADGINLAAGYAAVNGTVTSADTVNSAIEKLDGNQQDLIALSGVAQGATDLGTFTGDIIPDSSTVKNALQFLETELVDTRDNTDSLITLSGVAENATTLGTFTGVTIPDASTVKGALQSLETAHEEVDQNVNDLITLSGVAENSVDFGTFTGQTLADNQSAKQLFQRIETLLEQMRGVRVAGITAVTTVDQVPVASVAACKWLVEAFEVATPANRKSLEVFALNNGTLVDDTAYARLATGANFNLTITVDISAGQMRLRAASTTAGVTVTARRLEVTQSVL